VNAVSQPFHHMTTASPRTHREEVDAGNRAERRCWSVEDCASPSLSASPTIASFDHGTTAPLQRERPRLRSARLKSITLSEITRESGRRERTRTSLRSITAIAFSFIRRNFATHYKYVFCGSTTQMLDLPVVP
jgi:hypothetical protein